MYTLEPPEDDKVFKEVGGNISSLVGIRFPYSDVRSTVSGVWDDWMYGNRSVIALTCEIYRNLTALSYTPAGGDLYWERGITQMFNPEPTDIETVLHRWLPVFTYIAGLARPPLAGDVNGDKKVDGRDIAIVAKYFGSIGGYPPEADLNLDGKVDGKDIAIVAKDFGKTYI